MSNHLSLFVGVRRLELPTSTSRTWRATNCATPRTPLSSGAKLTLFSQFEIIVFLFLDEFTYFGIINFHDINACRK